MLTRVIEFNKKYHLFHAEDRILLACSGGPDSLCMVHLFMRLAEEYNLQIFAAHVEHGIRGKASVEDAQFVEKFCCIQHVPFYSKSVDACAYADRHKISLETAARELRYDFLQETAALLGCSAISVAHHRGDQAETVLMHILRGAGIDGLSGIRPKAGNIIRPLLDCTRAEIENYCVSYDLHPRYDATNGDIAYTRNRIRIELLPYLKNYNFNVEASLCRTADLLAEENDFLTTYSQIIYRKIAVRSGNKCIFSLEELLLQHVAIKRKIIRLAISDLCNDLKDIKNIHIDDIIKLSLKNKTGSVIDLPNSLKASVEYGKLIIFLEQIDTMNSDLYVLLRIPGNTEIFDKGITINAEVVNASQKLKTRKVCFIDKGKLAGRLKVRLRKNGDVFSPKGLNGHKKLKDLFIDNKIPRASRDKIPVLFDDRGIVWVAGIQQDSRCVPTEKTTVFIRLSLLDDNSILNFNN
ncbi:tRNA lysidine(34) synthetase TilS [Pectinatus haikarae]|uniref:tRNA(Ile)-lysidine synthase n=1 Tax=Pectinatus haikarae TaxID=349096 RepID=A0ABT9Y4K5_9FIRM|nr:tRNA lysidine(34) synthetase TilS [Pectinatus haikarae]MDQ0202757.1 tRNA(Ile)-lysidine synthase [Pectinatus haikarae]